MTLHLIDHIAFVLFAVAFPIWDFVATRKQIALIRAGRTELRMQLYRITIREEWVRALVLLGVWFALGRSSGAIGLAPQGGSLAWAGYGLTALICVGLLFQAWSIIRSPKNRASMRDKLGSVSWILPQTLTERRTFEALSVTASFCEEVIFRGFMIAYLMAVFGAPFWVAGLLSSVVFGFAHAYQGPAGIPRVAAVGGMLVLLYGLTGSLWAPIVAHAVTDFVTGRIGFAAFTENTSDHSPPKLAV